MSCCCRLLAPPPQQNHYAFAVFAEVNPVAGAEIDSEFEHSSAHCLDAGEVAYAEASNRDTDFGSGWRVQPVEPLRERAAATGIEVFDDFNLLRW
jgi:hypothetical protein